MSKRIKNLNTYKVLHHILNSQGTNEQNRQTPVNSVTEATQLAAEAQSVAQLALSTITDYEKKMTDISSTVAQLQQLVIDERKNRIKLESQLSSAQDKIGSAERQSRELLMENQKLASEVGSWQTAGNIQMPSQLFPAASGSTVAQSQTTRQPLSRAVAARGFAISLVRS